jgi:hypothetical protein
MEKFTNEKNTNIIGADITHKLLHQQASSEECEQSDQKEAGDSSGNTAKIIPMYPNIGHDNKD